MRQPALLLSFDEQRDRFGGHARPFRDAEHDGATQPGDHAMRVTSWNCSRGADVSRRGRQGPIIRI